ncbi:hypothetical protein [Aeromonas hydrophila]|uniref:hypothetical protein n=1 Tax=Aeromonas hydrophila TaxID=644 RepID=UPI0013E8B387|nr:hypothetical protein [Aeromonas hydrophila]MBS4671724.1 hypothetical protein [Aeromonas hydrophila]
MAPFLFLPIMNQLLAESAQSGQYLTEKYVFPFDTEHITMLEVLLIGDVHDRLRWWG